MNGWAITELISPFAWSATLMWVVYMFNKVRVGKRIVMSDLIVLAILGLIAISFLYAIVLQVTIVMKLK